MGRTRRERRADERRRADARLGRDRPPSAAWGDLPLDELVVAGAQHVAGRTADADHVVAALVGHGPSAREAVARRLTDALAALWARGWQPGDVVHAVGRLTDGRTGRLAALVVLAEADATGAAARAPAAWAAQLRALGPARRRRGSADLLARWADDEDVEPDIAMASALRLLSVLWARPDLAPLGPSPAQWTDDGADLSAPLDVDVDPKVLTRIRGLLAKAEGTTFPEEADAFTTKAQELMSRHAVDLALLRASATGGPASAVRSRRVAIHDPHAAARVELLAVVAEANGGRVVWDDEHGLATVLAHAGDLELIDLLFTSLLVQATHAAAATAGAAGRGRAPAFRRAFLLAYADRIGERLATARRETVADATARHGDALLPALAARAAAVEAAVDATFGPLAPGRTRYVDAEGWDAGVAAADRARLGGHRRPLPP